MNAPNRTPAGATDVVKFHLSLNVADLPRSLTFYTALFGTEPVKVYADYAKFELTDPPLILSLKPQRATKGGPLNHFGLRLKTVEELNEVRRRLEALGCRCSRQDDVRCCYAHQTKFWVADPDETLLEVYVLHADHDRWGEGRKLALMMPPLKALGFFGSIRRFLSKPFRRPAVTETNGSATAPLPPAEERVETPNGSACRVGGPTADEPR
ncbi:MAG TPA: ArsI/CadI family heavy metal resistance metalloenzyme [Gemmataceae bacterium]|nr:ArsI/CadI family heavy metal resistance metalloenzyme [Gemmataceae bacterium]